MLRKASSRLAQPTCYRHEKVGTGQTLKYSSGWMGVTTKYDGSAQQTVSFMCDRKQNMTLLDKNSLNVLPIAQHGPLLVRASCVKSSVNLGLTQHLDKAGGQLHISQGCN